MKLAQFWKPLVVLSAAATSTGALAADPQVDVVPLVVRTR